MRENPFGGESRGYFANYLNSLLQTGSATDVRFNVMNAFGLTAHQTEELLSGINRAKTETESRGERFDLTDYLEGYDFRGLTSEESTFTTDAGNIISKSARRATSETEVLLAQAADRLADVGEPILEFTNQAIEKTGEAVDMMKNFFENGLSGILDEWWDKIKEDISDIFWPKNNQPKSNNTHILSHCLFR